MAESDVIMELPSILHLPPLSKDSLHPYAQKNYLKFLTEVHEAVPTLCMLNEEDLKLFLPDSEYARLKACEDDIKAWLQKCSKDNDKITLEVYPYRSPFDAMWDLKKILKGVAERKAEKKRRLAALEEIGPSFDDAEKYLTPEENQKFFDSIPGAIDAYLARDKSAESYSPGIWLFNNKASNYSHWTWVIEDRRKEEIRQKQAEIEHDQYLDRLSAAVEKFKAELGKSKKPQFVYPPELEKYQPDDWCDVDLPDKQQIWNWAEDKILERLPQILVNLTRWELSWEVRVLPDASYEVAGVPCLTWYFNTYVLVKVNLELQKCVRRERRPGYTVEVQAEGEQLGTLYLGPIQWLTPGSFTTPIALLVLLAKGELEGPGIRVTERSPSFITFDVQGMSDEVEVCDDFRKFIRDIAKDKPLAEALLAKGLIDEDTAKLVEEKAKLPLPQLVSAQPGPAGSTLDNSDVEATLAALGYKTAEIKKGVEATPLSTGMSVEERVKAILKNMGG